MDKLMPGFDTEIARMAQRLLIQGRPIDSYTGVIATKVTPGVPGVKPVTIELTDFKTKKVVDTLEVDACMVATGRAPYTNGGCSSKCQAGSKGSPALAATHWLSMAIGWSAVALVLCAHEHIDTSMSCL